MLPLVRLSSCPSVPENRKRLSLIRSVAGIACCPELITTHVDSLCDKPSPTGIVGHKDASLFRSPSFIKLVSLAGVISAQHGEQGIR